MLAIFMIVGFVLGGLLVVAVGAYSYDVAILGAFGGALIGAAILIYSEVHELKIMYLREKAEKKKTEEKTE